MVFLLSKGRSTLIDVCDLPLVQLYSWHVDYYVNRCHEYVVSSTRPHCTYMHRLLLNARRGEEVAHLNNDGLDNRRANLRICSHAECGYKQRPQKGRTSQYKGVYFNGRKYNAYCHPPKGKVHLGTFIDERDAAKAYDDAVREMYGDLAKTNF